MSPLLPFSLHLVELSRQRAASKRAQRAIALMALSRTDDQHQAEVRAELKSALAELDGRDPA